ncbi:MAG: hypothetical protein IIC46_14515 [Planctomycetes bacterium]|nr:hypothetical protein [Planctomycetota bacterium]
MIESMGRIALESLHSLDECLIQGTILGRHIKTEAMQRPDGWSGSVFIGRLRKPAAQTAQ